MQPVVLHDDVVRLRPHRPDDLPDVLRQGLDPEMARWTSVPRPYERRDAVEFVERLQPQGWRDMTSLGWAIENEGRFCGTLDIRLDGQRGGDLGFALGGWARGRGLVPAALRLAVPWAFAELGLEVVHWKAYVGNWSSRRAAWKVGFPVEGTVRSFLSARGERHDAWVGSLLPHEPLVPRHPWYVASVLPGRGLRLRAWRDSDAERVVAAGTDEVSRRFLGALPHPYGPAEAMAYISSREEEHASGRGVYWAVADTEDDGLLGSVAVMGLHGSGGAGEVGYWTVPDARGRGVMSEAVRVLARQAFRPAADGGLGLRRLALLAAVGNAASQGVARAAGFVPYGRQRAAEVLGDGSVTDLMAFDRLAGDPDPG